MALPLSYNLRNLGARRMSAALTLIVIAVVVMVFAVLLSYAAGIRASLRASGSPRNVLVLKPGATAESTSIIRQFEADKVVQAPGIAFSEGGEPLISRELCVQTNVPRKDGGAANVAVRGLDGVGFVVHSDLRIVEGRVFEQGAMECIVGRAASERFAGLRVGDEVSLGRAANRMFRVVGVFTSGGGALESEIIAGRTMLNDAYQRGYYSSLLVRLEDASRADDAIRYINGSAVALEAKRETQYYDDLSKRMREIVQITVVLTTIMAIGAAFAVANTMFAAVDARRREIAMLRTIGFSRGAILASFVFEALCIGGCGCAAGLALSVLLSSVSGSQDFLSDTTWTVMTFDMRVTPGIAAAAISVTVLVSVLGAAFPAIRASRVRLIDALRRA